MSPPPEYSKSHTKKGSDIKVTNNEWISRYQQGVCQKRPAAGRKHRQEDGYTWLTEVMKRKRRVNSAQPVNTLRHIHWLIYGVLVTFISAYAIFGRICVILMEFVLTIDWIVVYQLYHIQDFYAHIVQKYSPNSSPNNSCLMPNESMSYGPIVKIKETITHPLSFRTE